jgi:hypothetical protein
MSSNMTFKMFQARKSLPTNWALGIIRGVLKEKSSAGLLSHVDCQHLTVGQPVNKSKPDRYGSIVST